MRPNTNQMNEEMAPVDGGEMDEMAEGSDSEVLSMADYPQLKEAQQGMTIEGTFTGKVESIDGDNVTVSYDKFDITVGNSADRAYNKMRGASAGGQVQGDEDSY